ncbi:MAG: VanW family protein [Ardenticatenaceae bacterium]|nr:VanW family protein [Ardenticatenaceae bacterium]MCB8950296.1 VanW family protein [Ardenticatenaceae bacterium]
MQATAPQPMMNTRRNLAFFLAPVLAGFLLLFVVLAIWLVSYQSRHNGRIFTGISVMGVDLSGMEIAEAETALNQNFNYANTEQIVFVDPETQTEFSKTPSELGLTFDTSQTVQAAYDLGRTGGPFQQAQEMFSSWYYGRSLSPVLVLDESQLDGALAELAADINKPPVSAAFNYSGSDTSYAVGQPGRFVDVADARNRVITPLTSFRPAQVELLVHEVAPAVFDAGDAAAEIQQVLGSPITFYLEEPLDNLDLEPITLSQSDLAAWVRVEVSESASGSRTHGVFVDENALRHWLRQFEEQIYREPVNARYYFDDGTEELVLVAPHVNGRELDIEATIEQFKAQVNTPNRSIPFVVRDIVPLANSSATAADLGITELITETTTWFSGSSDARKHNIATAAANFYGIVVAPYEEFSFNKYLGSITEADGYTEGLIIVGGLTIPGVGGGVCQVSTTLYQTAFFAGFPITERLPHGYMLGYYRDGAGHGMDATVYNDGNINIDMKFINNTPYHLLIENYFSEENQALTFKFYSTSMGRTVVKEDPVFANVTEVPGPEQDRWEYVESVEPGTVEKIDWATEGADVSIRRLVYNADGQIIEDRTFVSNYIPVPNVFHYGPDVEPYSYDLVPEDDH